MPWPGLARRFPVLGYRDFRFLLADRLLAPAAFAFSMVGVSFAVLDATGSAADLSYVLAAQILPALVFALAGGVFRSSCAAQRVIVAANLMIAAGEGGFGLLVLLGQPQLWQMIALETLTSTASPCSPGLTGAAAPARARPPAPGGQRHEPPGDERGADGGRRHRGPVRGRDRARLGARRDLRGRHAGHRADAAGPSGRPVPSARSATARSANCVTGGRPSPPASGYGSPPASTAWSSPPGSARSTCSGPWWPGCTWAAPPPGA